MRVLVTGGAGFIGSHIVDRLIANGHHPTVLDNFSTGKRNNLANVLRSKSLVITRGDIRRIHRLLPKLERVDRVCHLAAMTDVHASIRDPVLTSEVNLTGTLRVLETARKLGAGRVVFASSAAVYGSPSTFPVTEDVDVVPISPYGASKAASELYCGSFEENHGIETISLRYFNIYGPRQASTQYSGVISVFARRLLRRLPLRIFGDGSQSRDFIYVADAVEATVAALEKPLLNRVFNIATGRETTILKLAEKMREIAGVSSHLRFEPARKGDIKRSVADISRARSELNFFPRSSLHDGLTTTIQWFS